MFKYRGVMLHLAFLAALLIAAAPVIARAGEDLKRFHALCVGLAYPGTGYKLDYTTRDAAMVAEAFGSASGFDPEASRIDLLVDDDLRTGAKPTPEEIRRRLLAIAREAEDGDRIVFYFSGHGAKAGDGRSFLLCHGGRDREDDRGLLPLSDVRSILAESGAESKLVIVDACHSGGKAAGTNGLTSRDLMDAFGREDGSKAAGDGTLAWLSSSDVNEESFEYTERQQGLFTHFLLEAINREAGVADISKDGMLSVAEIHRYVNNQITTFIAGEDKNPASIWRGRNQTPRAGIGGELTLNPMASDLRWRNLFYVNSPPSAPPPASRIDPASQALSFGPSSGGETSRALAEAERLLNPAYDPSSRSLRSGNDALVLVAEAQLLKIAETGGEPGVRIWRWLGRCAAYSGDMAGAAEWHRRAAEAGDALSQYILGEAYASGAGVERDRAEASSWFRKAAEQGDAEARSWVERNDLHLAALALGDERLAAEDWRGAEKAYAAALGVPGYAGDAGAKEGLERARNGASLKAYSQAMSEGDTALAAEDWADAEEAYAAALAVPGYAGDAEAKEGLAAAKGGAPRKVYKLAMALGDEKLAREDWRGAEVAFAAVLKVPGYGNDPAAKEGLAAAKGGASRKAYMAAMTEGEAALAARDMRAAEQAFTVALSLPGYGNDARARDGLAKATGKLALDCGSGVTLELVRIPAGRFMMGSPSSEAKRDDDEVQHEVTITKPFYMGIYEVTQAQWRAVMGGNPSKFSGDDNPVEQVSWNGAVEFCRKLSAKTGRKVRLPTEAEWEYACRAGTTTAFNTGETISTDQANYDGNYTYGSGRKGVYREKTTPVGSFGANAWGLYDMHGNVWEWCSDWYGKYDLAKTKDPQGMSSGTHRVVRGGSWSFSPGLCRSAGRLRYEPGVRDGDIGFRVVLD